MPDTEQRLWGGFSTSPAELATLDVARVRLAYPSLFRRLPVQPEPIAHELDIGIEFSAPLRGRAQLSVSSGEFLITVDPELGLPIRRFALAHEIGHAVLFKSHPEIAREFALTARETYAHRFASDLLLPTSAWPTVVAVIQAATHPRDILNLSSRLGLSPAAVLKIASSRPNWFYGVDTIWLRVKTMANPATGLEPRLRVVSAHYDRTKYFVPQYISLRSLCGDQWLSMLTPGGEAEISDVRVQLSFRNSVGPTKYRRDTVHAQLRGLRLSPSEHDGVPYYIVCINVRGLEQTCAAANVDELLQQLQASADSEDFLVAAGSSSFETVQLALW